MRDVAVTDDEVQLVALPLLDLALAVALAAPVAGRGQFREVRRLVLPLLPLYARLGRTPGVLRVHPARRAFLPRLDLRGVVACVHDAVAPEVLRQARGKRLRPHVVLGERLERPRELGLVRDVGDGLPAAKAPDGRRFPHGGDQGLGVGIVAHRLEDVRLEQADPAARRTPVPAPPVLGEHLVVDEQFAYPHELLHFFAEFPDVVLDAGYEVCLDRVPVPAKPVWRHFREIGPFVLCFHAYSIA